MIAKNKQRVSITIDKEFLEQIKTASEEWNLTLSEYFLSLATEDLTIGITAQARRRSGNNDNDK